MADKDIDNFAASDLDNAMSDFSVDSESTESSDGSGDYRYQNPDWAEDYGFYLSIPEFKKAVDTKALWTIGAGFEAEPETEALLSKIKGNGKDSFNSILKNLIKVKTISRDSFAEIIYEDDIIVNLKPLDPSSIVIIQGKDGLIKGYEQVTKKGVKVADFDVDEMFHLSHDRVADEIKGTRIMDSLKPLILMRNEAMTDWKKVLHRNVAPLQIHYIDGDDKTKVANYKAKADAARADGENMYVPKGTVEIEVIQSQLNQASSPLAWIAQLNDYFFQVVGVPQIIIGQGKEFTDASGKIVYLAYEQSVKDEQLYIEEQVLGQLNLEINLTFPASLQNELISSRDKDGELQAAEPNDTTAELEGNQ